MSNIEEIKQIVADVLDKKGILGQLKAQIRKEVFDVVCQAHVENPKASTDEDEVEKSLKLLTLELLRYWNLKYSASVFEAEAGISKLTRLQPQLKNATKPLLLQLLQDSNLVTAAELGITDLSTGSDATSDHSIASSFDDRQFDDIDEIENI